MPIHRNHESATQAPEQFPPGDGAGAACRAERQGPAVVGVGASAGGLLAFRALLGAMPAHSGAAFVLVPHLDPNHASLLVELLAQHTTMPVVQIQSDMSVQADHVYIIPPNRFLTIRQGVLCLTGPIERHTSQTSIDLFLRSLADDQQEQAVCIILSGTGSHGSLGLKAVKAAGGMAMVQDPQTAEYPAMPQSAIATGQADYVLPVDQMAAPLLRYIQHSYVLGGKTVDEVETPDHLDQVLALVCAETRLDFHAYRKKMLVRRIERRMGLIHSEHLTDYLAYLREHADEVKHLARDLLISVTSFFRDPGTWHTLETEVLAPLVRDRQPGEPLRAWCVGCATGEEPYSLGILLLEQLAAAQKSCPVQIFATDIEDDALEVARKGIYPESIAAVVPAERLGRFFVRLSDASYEVCKPLREIVTFAHQNVITDAPFSRLDLVVCRNLLIYLKPDVQKRILALLHFGLVEGGTLFLGTSETIGRNLDLFEPISAKQRIYRRIGLVRIGNLTNPRIPQGARQPRAEPSSPLQLPPRLAEMAQGLLLRRYALACIVINRNYEILHFAGPTANFLAQPSGRSTRDLLTLAHPDLAARLRVVIQQAIRQNALQSVKNVMLRHADVLHRVNIDVEPLSLSRQTEGLLLISFQEQPLPPGETPTEEQACPQTADTGMVEQFEQELASTRSDPQSTIEELEGSNEELKASNEETMSMNEELQSANEELETSKEELQSLNEELNTLNSQLREKIQELQQANNDIANLFHCTDIPTVFLDGSYRIKRFTPASTRLFHLIAADVGRPLGDITQRFADDTLLHDAQQLLRDWNPCEREVQAEDGRWYVRRILPYRTLDDHIDGVVITFVDITERKLATDAVVRRLAAIVESSADAIFSKDLDGTIRTWNGGAERLYGYRPEETVGRSARMLVPDDRQEEWTMIMARLARGEAIEQLETERLRKDGQRVTVALTLSPIRIGTGEVASIAVIGRDIDDRRRDEEALRREHELSEGLLNNAPTIVLLLDTQGRILRFNAFMERLTGWQLAEVQDRDCCDTFVPLRDREVIRDRFRRALHGERTRGAVHLIVTRDGRERCIEWYDAPLTDAHGRVMGLICTGQDVTERREAERALRENETRLAAILQQLPLGVGLLDTSGQWVLSNALMRHYVPQLVPSRDPERRVRWRSVTADGQPLDPSQWPGARALRGEVVSPGLEFSYTDEKARDNWILVSAVPFRGTDDQLAGAIAVVQDITERKRGDWEQARLAAIVESTSDAVIGEALDGTIDSWNKGAERIFGYSRDEVLGQPLALLVPPDRQQEMETIRQRIKSGERVDQFETVRRCKEGRLIDVSLAVSPIHDRIGRMLGVSVTARDITERKRIERALTESEARMRAILNTAADAIITIDKHGSMTSVNAATERLFGYTQDELIGRNIALLMPSPYAEEHDRYLDRYLATREAKIIGVGRELVARRKDGSIFPVDLAVSEIKHLGLFTGILRDISRRKELEREVVENVSLEQHRIGQDLHDTVAQELTALNMLAAELVQTLRSDPASGTLLVDRMVQGLQRSQQELRAVLRGLLPVAVDAQGLMAALADLADRTRTESHVACLFDCPEPIAVTDNLTATHLYLIALEAVRNALKHARPQSVRISLTANHLLVLRVQDDGSGVPPVPTKLHGLGLRVMQNRAAIIGARLTIEATQPAGTVVTCILSLKSQDQGHEASAEPAPA